MDRSEEINKIKIKKSKRILKTKQFKIKPLLLFSSSSVTHTHKKNSGEEKLGTIDKGGREKLKN